jgi:type II secretory pathway component PulK
MVTLTGVGVGVVVTVVGGLILREIWRWRESSIQERSEREEWYAETVAICEQALQALQNHQHSGPPTFDETRMEMRTASSQLSRHAGDAVRLDVDEEVVELVKKASRGCQNLNITPPQGTDLSPWEEAYAQAEEALQQARDEAKVRL